jgi:pimeloyl-ACP methyl ester carboxylesterase
VAPNWHTTHRDLAGRSLVHGTGADAATWQSIVANLATRHRVITYDRRDYGRSTTHRCGIIAYMSATSPPSLSTSALRARTGLELRRNTALALASPHSPPATSRDTALATISARGR